jgi:hypothetical protein
MRLLPWRLYLPELEEVPPVPELPELPPDDDLPMLEPELVDPLVPEAPELPPASSLFWQPARPPRAMVTANSAIIPLACFMSVSSFVQSEKGCRRTSGGSCNPCHSEAASLSWFRATLGRFALAQRRSWTFPIALAPALPNQ